MCPLEEYIYNSIVPRYASFDPAHRQDHVLTVIKESFRLLDMMPEWVSAHPGCNPVWRQTVNRDMLLVAAACHDLGLVNGRENHHMDSGVIIRNDSFLRGVFSDEEIEIIAQAAEDHRASGTRTPRSVYGMLVAEADRVIEPDTIILRTLQYGFQHYPDMDRDSHLKRAADHLQEKYGRGGYLKLWIPWSDNATRLEELQSLIDKPDLLYQRLIEIFSIKKRES